MAIRDSNEDDSATAAPASDLTPREKSELAKASAHG
jgi:hypothetical protein